MKRTVLVIDDDRDYRSSVQTLLEGAGYQVDTAASGKEGLAKLSEHRPDVIVLDVMMETLVDGYAVNQKIRFQPDFESYADIPIVKVSSIEESPDERLGRSGDVEMVRPTRYLTKPLDIPLFLEVLERAMRGRSAAT